MRLRVDALKLLAERCDDLERRVFALEEVPSIHWHFDEAHNILVQESHLYGGEPRSVQHDHAPPINQGDGLTFFRYAEAFDLGEGERLLRLNESGGRPFRHEPVVQVISEIGKKARAVTRHQSKQRVGIDAESLQSRLRAARTRELADARALASGLTLNGRQQAQPQPRSAYVCIHHPQGRGFPGGLAFSYIETTSQSGQEEVYVTNQPPPGLASPAETLERFSKVFGQEVQGELINGGLGGDATRNIARLLGYHPEDVTLIHPADQSG